MKGLQLLLFSLMFLGHDLLAAERLNEDITKSLIVRQLLSLVEWQEPQAKSRSSQQVQLCTLHDRRSFRSLSEHLQGVSVAQGSINIRNVEIREELINCDVVYLNHPKNQDVNWIIQNQIAHSTFFIVEGAEYAEKGFHIGLYLNEKRTFEFELNPDALIDSRFTPKPELFKLGTVLASKAAEKINLLRSLINYTDWQSHNEKFLAAKSFQLCILNQPTLNVFIQHYMQGKQFKNKTLDSRNIESSAQSNGCNAVYLSDTHNRNMPQFLLQRNQQKILLIGNDLDLGEQGVHYNLMPKDREERRRFEINLVAFAQTGHSPRFELFNSGVVIQLDYPELFKVVFNIIQQTNWPNLNASQANLPIEVCVESDLPFIQHFEMFLPLRQFIFPLATQQLKPVKLRLLESPYQTKGCGVVLAQSSASFELMEQQMTDRPLVIVCQPKSNGIGKFHYNLLIDPKHISYELNFEQLKAQGFQPVKTLMSVSHDNQGAQR